ncbi:MAG: hypothetical protein H6551_02455 [Chitinophagales bacterium]|nr:hypothetical protein [Chitinophagales bacterium]
MLIHLHATAGESIIISRLNTCKPVISVQLNTDMMNELKTDLQQKSEKVLAVYMVVKGKPSTTAIAGRYSINGDKLSFTPVYALGYNIEFEIQYRTGTNTIIKHFTTPKHPLSEQTANVVTAYPLSDTIPYNTLFFHVRFSHSMKNDKLAYTHISIYDEAGIEREKAWRQKSFWLDDGKLLVLMIHPGRVKNGIHYESPLFDSGKTYTLKVNEDIEDINGNSIAKSYSKTFYVIGEDRVSPKPYFENAALPTAGSKQPLLLTFSESMDYASVFAGVKLYNVKGKEVALSIKNKTDDSYMLFPNRQWVKGKYTLILKGAVYDIAANRINRLFEITDVNEIKKDQRRTEWSFEIK